MSAGESVASVAAPSKVNLSLRVLGKREDGFHEIRTVFQAVDLADEVRVRPGGRGVSLEVFGADVGPERENLAYRAAAAFLAAAGETTGARIELIKRIPAGAGLGGGSSDAAAVLRCLAALSSASPTAEDLARIGVALGSDVPFFLLGGPLARGEGRGEVLVPLEPLPEAHLVVALPPVHVGTADAYRVLARARAQRGSVAPAVEDEADRAPRDWHEVLRDLHNDFETIVGAACAEIERSLEALRHAGARGVLMSGSGAASFGLFQDRSEALRVAANLTTELGWSFEAARTLTTMPRVTIAS